MSNMLKGRRVIVTGGARGIGRAVVELLHDSGAQVLIADIDAEGSKRTEEEVGAGSQRLRSCAVDIADVDQIDAMIDFVLAEFGGLDVLVNNASHARFGLVLDLTEEDWDYSYEVGLKGNFFCMQRAARVMIDSGAGKIVNVSSMTVPLGHARNCAYSAMKGGVEVMTKVAAVELAEYGIQVNAVAPGPVDTPLARSIQTEWGWKQRINHLPGGSFAEPGDIAGAIAFLASDLSDWITGTILPVDGGYTATGARVEPKGEP